MNYLGYTTYIDYGKRSCIKSEIRRTAERAVILLLSHETILYSEIFLASSIECSDV